MSRPSSGRPHPARKASDVPPRVAPRPVQWDEPAWLAALPPVLQAVGLDLPIAQQIQLARYMGMLSHWNATYNLTALRSAPDMLTHHLADCLVVLPPLMRHLRQRADAHAVSTLPHVLDVGSGGGLPGVVLAVCCGSLRVSCVDTVGKKAAFIRQVGAELRLAHLRGEHARVEQLPGTYDIITSRAFASLDDFIRLTRAQLAPGGVWLAMKGKVPEDELKALPPDVEVFHVEHLMVPGLEAERCLIWMRLAPVAG